MSREPNPFVIPRRRSKPDSGLRALFRKHLPSFHIASIETGITVTGVPDMNYCYGGIEGWVEMKACAHWRVKVRPEQVAWIENRIRHGGRVFVAVRRARTELWLYHGRMAGDLTTRPLDTVPGIGHWNGGPGWWDWDAIGRLLLTIK